MSTKILGDLIEYLKIVKGWTDTEVVDLLEYLTEKRK